VFPVAHTHTRGADAGDHHGARDRPRPQHDTEPDDATSRIRNILAVDYDAGLFAASRHEPAVSRADSAIERFMVAAFI
jgi:hypothetical protein